MSSDFEISRDNCISIIYMISVFSLFISSLDIFLLLVAPVSSDFSCAFKLTYTYFEMVFKDKVCKCLALLHI